MSTSLQPTEPRPARVVGRNIAGVALMLGWAGAHVVLFYLLAVGGLLTEVFLMPVKAILFAGTAQTASPPSFAWDWMPKTGVIPAGAAGVPAGLAVIWRHKRKVLMRCFWMALLAGVVCELIAFATFISGALSAP